MGLLAFIVAFVMVCEGHPGWAFFTMLLAIGAVK